MKGKVTKTSPLEVKPDGYSYSQTWDEVIPLESKVRFFGDNPNLG
jgi:hypothetical protein